MEEAKLTRTKEANKIALELMIQALAAKPTLMGNHGSAEAAATDLVKGAAVIAAFITDKPSS